MERIILEPNITGFKRLGLILQVVSAALIEPKKKILWCIPEKSYSTTYLINRIVDAVPRHFIKKLTYQTIYFYNKSFIRIKKT